METILLAITAVSLLVALIMSAAAWRMSREERARSAVRVAALAAAASESAAGGSKVGWRGRSLDRPAQTLSNALLADELPLRTVGGTEVGASAIAWRSPSLDRPEAVNSDGRQRGLMVAAAVLFVLVGGGAYWSLSSGAASNATASAAAASSHAPLELMSLRHDRQGGRLTLSGLVRNPTAGAPLEGLAAVAFLFDAQGGFISSARVGVDFKRLAPGDESPFVITLDAPSNVARYRVSFRTEAGVVAHVDRRSDQPVATAIVR